MICILFVLINGGTITLEEITLIRIEMFHHIKVTEQNNFVLICSNPSSQMAQAVQNLANKNVLHGIANPLVFS